MIHFYFEYIFKYTQSEPGLTTQGNRSITGFLVAWSEISLYRHLLQIKSTDANFPVGCNFPSNSAGSLREKLLKKLEDRSSPHTSPEKSFITTTTETEQDISSE